MKKKNEFSAVFVAIVLLVGTSFFMGGCGEKPPQRRPAKVKIGPNTWVVELAMTRNARYAGLSGRGQLPDGTGMLFIYPEPIPLKFCMRGCLIPIDIVFIGFDLRVVNTYAMQVEPGRRGLASYSSGVEAQYALELPGGTVRKCGIRNGDQIELIDVPGAAQAEPAE